MKNANMPVGCVEDGKLLFRLNNVMRRVGLRQVPDSLTDFFPEARRQIRERQAELMDGESQPLWSTHTE